MIPQVSRVLAPVYVHTRLPYTKRVDGTAAKFRIQTYREYGRVTGLYGGPRPTLEELLEDVRSDDTFYDVGANIGVVSCLVGGKIERGSVVAFEPEPSNARRLRAHLRNNNIEHDVHEVALGDEPGDIALKLDGTGAGAGSHSIAASKTGSTVPVQMLTLDSLVNDDEIPPPSVIYMDAEGAEYNVLMGARGTIQMDKCRLMHIQLHEDVKVGNELNDFGASVQDVITLVERCGFETSFRAKNMKNRFLVAEK